ncbi:MAG: hypothetical protein WDN75_10080 [Bacteroidota bacterium]
MKEIISILRLYAKYCLFFQGGSPYESILGIIGWAAIVVLGYSVFQIIFV